MPAFVYSGNTSIWNTTQELYRVYVFTDQDCLNTVFRGAVVGSPGLRAAPDRPARPADRRHRDHGSPERATSPTGREPDSYTADYIVGEDATRSDVSRGTAATAGTPASRRPRSSTRRQGRPLGQRLVRRPLLLDGHAGRRRARQRAVTTTLAQRGHCAGDTTITVANGTGIVAGDALTRRFPAGENADREVASSGNSITLGPPASAPSTAPAKSRPRGRRSHLPRGGADPGRLRRRPPAELRQVERAGRHRPERRPYASGLSPDGQARRRAGRPRRRFYGQPLVAWQPAAAPDSTRCSGARSSTRGRRRAPSSPGATSLTLPLSPGTWYYRVRGLDFLMAGSKPQMSWSDPVAARGRRSRASGVVR